MDWLAEVGGLVRAIFIIGQGMMGPYAKYHLNALLAWLLVRVVPTSECEDNTKEKVHLSDIEKKRNFI